ncbi:MAG: hypothetical protein GY928_02405 [Colwellia sp.]|nr:hypothetical protein [Colwellia sp.]
MKYPNIDNIEFSHGSKQALKRLKELFKYLQALITTETIATIFLGAKPSSAINNIYASDFLHTEEFKQSMLDLEALEPKLARQGDHIPELCLCLNARRSEVKANLKCQLKGAERC